MTDKRKRGQYGRKVDPWLNLTVMLNGYAKYTGISIGRALGVCENTGRARLSKPETLTIGELKRLCKTYDISQDEILGAIKIGV